MEFGIYSLYSNLLSTKVKFCSLCFKIVSDDASCIQDIVLLASDENDVDHCKDEEVDIHYILQEILGAKTASNLSATDAICDKCTRSALNSYKFVRMCRNNTKSMATTVDVLTNAIADTQIEFDDHPTLFLSMNLKESECSQYLDTVKYEDNRTALKRFLCLCKPFRVINDNKGNTKYQCTLCPAFYVQKSAARKHFNAKHVDDHTLLEIKTEVETPKREPYKRGKDRYDIQKTDGRTMYKCKKCMAKYTKAQNVIRHYQMAHDRNPRFTLKRKGKVEGRGIKDNVRYQNSHVEIKGEDGSVKYQCTLCKKVCTKAGNALQHFQSHVTKQKVKSEFENLPLSLPCSFCKENFDSKNILAQHILQKHSIESVEDFSNIDIENIYSHIYTVALDENGVEKFCCKVCSKLFKKYTTLKVHFDNIHLKLPTTKTTNVSCYICSHCGKECKNSSALKKHEEYHTLTLVCPTCNKKYRSRQCFKTHVCFRETARNEMKKDFMCDACGKSFVSKTSLRIHVKYRHDTDSMRFPCQYCPKKFGSKSQWKNHQVTHTKERNFTCDLCGNVFVTQMALVYHRRLHTGETPFQCKYCDLKFINTSRRADHVRRHHISAAATCDICGVTVKAIGLKKHRRRHFDVKSTLCINREGGIRKRQVSKKQSSYDSDSDTS